MPAVGRSRRVRVSQGKSEGASLEEATPGTSGSFIPKAGRTNKKRGVHTAHPPLRFFPIFRRLPAELRLYVWELSHAAVIEDGLIHRIRTRYRYQKGRIYDRFIAGGEPNNAAARAILTVDRESRHAALSKALPDAVAHPGCEGGIIRAKLERDIFLLCDTSVLYTPPPMPGYFSGGGDPGLGPGPAFA